MGRPVGLLRKRLLAEFEWEVPMESMLGNLAREVAAEQMIRDHLKEMRETARVARLLKVALPPQPAWYCPLLVSLGNALIGFGTRLRTRYPVQPALRARDLV